MCATEPDERSPPDGAADGPAPLDASPPTSTSPTPSRKRLECFRSILAHDDDERSEPPDSAYGPRTSRARASRSMYAGDGRPSGIAADEPCRRSGDGAETAAARRAAAAGSRRPRTRGGGTLSETRVVDFSSGEGSRTGRATSRATATTPATAPCRRRHRRRRRDGRRTRLERRQHRLGARRRRNRRRADPHPTHPGRARKRRHHELRGSVVAAAECRLVR